MPNTESSARSRHSLVEYIQEFRLHGGDAFYVEQRGYRRVAWSYAQLTDCAVQFARELDARDISHGERVLIWGRNSAEWVAAFLGCILRGAVAVPIDQIATSEFAARVADQVNARLIVAEREKVLSTPAPRFDLDTLRDAVAAHSAQLYPSPAVDRSSVAEILFTSGTTAEPKGVVLSHGNILANIEPLEVAMQPYQKWERLVHPLRFLNVVPLSHVFGQFMGLWIPPLLGATVVSQDALNPAEIARAIHDEHVSVLIAVPRVLRSLRNKIERDAEGRGRADEFRRAFAAAENEHFLRRIWRFRGLHRQFGWKFWAVISGGATLDAETEQFWTRTGFAAIQGYGLTETTSLVSVNHPFRLGHGSIGKILEGREVKLDASGEILVRGENVAAGYWQRGDIRPVDGSDAGGWFHTGDLGALDEAGNLYFKGRKKQVIVTSAGMNVSPDDLEAALCNEPEVKDCVVFGVARGGNEEPCAVLLLRQVRGVDDPDLAAKAALERANSRLAEYQRVRCWCLWPGADFPRTSTGKPRLADIREVAESAFVPGAPRTAIPSSSGDAGSVAELLARVQGKLGSGGLGLETELGLSSLDRVELLGAIEDRYQIQLNETQFTGAKTVGDLDRLVRESSSSAEDSRTNFQFPRWPQSWPVRWLRTLTYYLLTWPATHLLAHPRISGRERLREVKGPVLVISNHVLYLDVGFVLAALPMRLRHRLAVAIGGERLAEMRRPPRDWFFLRRWRYRLNYLLVTALFNVFPLPKRSAFRESFRFAGELVDRGWSVLVFPEGDLTPDGRLQPFRGGIGLLARNLAIPLVPMRIDGAYEIREAGTIFNRPGRVRVTIGDPIHFSSATDPEEITREIQQRVAQLNAK